MANFSFKGGWRGKVAIVCPLGKCSLSGGICQKSMFRAIWGTCCIEKNTHALTSSRLYSLAGGILQEELGLKWDKVLFYAGWHQMKGRLGSSRCVPSPGCGGGLKDFSTLDSILPQASGRGISELHLKYPGAQNAAPPLPSCEGDGFPGHLLGSCVVENLQLVKRFQGKSGSGPEGTGSGQERAAFRLDMLI